MSNVEQEKSDTKYDFQIAGEQIAATLIKAAEDQVMKANNVLANAKVVADGIRAQIAEQIKMMTDLNGRLHVFGESVTEAHIKFLDSIK